jgi:hypothetical protein
MFSSLIVFIQRAALPLPPEMCSADALLSARLARGQSGQQESQDERREGSDMLDAGAINSVRLPASFFSDLGSDDGGGGVAGQQELQDDDDVF